ncbi:D-lysergyl-peptide-synthetase subunit 3 [Metarhizium brunneum]|uniref:D-lysergyl-peptide-synthetase subunit 3 n=1 Tax=Metarhizium brunneum TaxID=500148 RepID=A0A7D5UX08_9HYPO|nr:D-lysergyl-peptide-synthetase subunit 3 [Metarhizium brunneum]
MANEKAALEFWSSKLQAAEPCILTLSNRSTAAPSSSTIEAVTIDLEEIGNSWSEYFNVCNVSTSAILMTAWGMVLHTYTDSDEVCFGHTFTTRQKPVNGHDALNGPQVNILPFFLEFEGEATLLETVRKSQLDLADAQSNQDVSLAEICSHMGMETNALFNTCMLFSSDEQTPPDAAPDISSQEVTLMEGCPQYDIIIHVSSSKQCVLLYQSHYLSNDQAVHIAGALRVALTSIIDSPHLVTEKVEIFSPVDENKISQWNETAPVASESCLHDLINQQCDLHPDSLAVVAWDGSFTYGELDRLSNTLAQRLFLEGIGPDVFVAICADRCKWIPVAMLGIIKAGGAFCALDPSHPPSRLKEMCKALGSSMVITTADDAQKADELALTTIVLGDDSMTEPNGTKFSLERPSSSKTRPSHALYSVFTSGSSGNPKGVVIEHRSFASTALASLKPLNIRPEDRILHFASYAFDLSVFEVLTALTAGASVAIPSEKARMEFLPRAATELEATWTFLTPTVARMYRPSDFPTLRTISLGGELVQTSDIEFWASKNLITGYNPAECCPLGISGPANLSEANFLGWPFVSHAAWVVDTRDFQKLVPVGAIGELIIEGPAVARCYLHDKQNALPDSPFIISPPRWLTRFRGEASPDARLYRTGDLVRYGFNGAVHYIGRKDFQIKIRGQRVELGEIESQLRTAFSAGNHCVAVEAVKLSGWTTLVAFISMNSSDSVTNRDAAPTVRLQDITQELEIYVGGVATKLRGILPASMIPAAFLPVTHIPVSKSGKVDRKQLRALASSLSPEVLFRSKGESTSGNLPETDDERRLQALFAQVLGISPSNITADSDFFRLGGDSVQAMKLLALVSQEELFGLTYSDIFQHPRLRDMLNASRSRSSFIDSDDETVSTDSGLTPFCLVKDANTLIDIASDQCGINKGNIEDIYPCTSTQANIMASAAPDGDPCVSIRSFKLQHNIDKALVKQAWSITSQGHSILRTRIIQSKTGAFFQVVVREDICWSDYTDGDDSNSRFRPSFALGSPSVQLCFMKGRLYVAIHHALYDAWSLSRLLNEVDEAYCQLSVRQLPPLNRYVKHVAESLDSVASFWKAELEDAHPAHFPELPSNKANLETISTPTKSIGTTMPIDSERRSNVEYELQLAWAITCYSYTKNEDVIFGIVSSGRNIPLEGVDKMLGPIFGITPLRVPIDPAEEVAEAIEELQYRSEEQAAYTHLGLHRISQLGQTAAAACRFQTLLVVEPNESEIQGTWFCDHEIIYDSIEPRHHSLTLKCLVKPRFVDVTAIFHQSILPDAQKQDILLRFQHIFQQIHTSDAPDSTIMDIDTETPQNFDGIQHSSLFVKNVGSDYTTANQLHNRDIFLCNSPKSEINHSPSMVEHALEEVAQAQNSSCRTGTRLESQQLAQASEAVNLVAEIDRYDGTIAIAQQEELASAKRSSRADDLYFKPHAGMSITVFLTGSNGFIGTEVLRQLLENHNIRRVIALVRGSSAQEARSRTIDSAKKALWWTDGHGEKLDVWPGDLSLPHLGLDSEHWSILEDGTTVDAVIHNGASVHWLKSYAALEGTNVRSTAELLRIAVKTPHVRFTYVSSGRYQDPVEEVEEQVAMQFAAGGIPYSQTKFVAESLVRRAAARIPSRLSNLAVASLGLVIGTPTEGVVNSDDYIWRLVAACIKAGVCNADELDKWFPVSDVARTASIIVDTVLEPVTTSAPVKQVTGGITWREIWDIVTEMGYTIESRPAMDWMRAIRQDIEVEREHHPLWTLAQMIEGSIDNKEPMWAASWCGNQAASVRLKGAVKHSIQFLGEIGFIPKSGLKVQEQVHKIHRGAFSRS